MRTGSSHACGLRALLPALFIGFAASCYESTPPRPAPPFADAGVDVDAVTDRIEVMDVTDLAEEEAPPCTRDSDCDDEDPCTRDLCDITAGRCEHEPLPMIITQVIDGSVPRAFDVSRGDGCFTMGLANYSGAGTFDACRLEKGDAGVWALEDCTRLADRESERGWDSSVTHDGEHVYAATYISLGDELYYKIEVYRDGLDDPVAILDPSNFIELEWSGRYLFLSGDWCRFSWIDTAAGEMVTVQPESGCLESCIPMSYGASCPPYDKVPVEFLSPEEASIVTMNADGVLRELRVAADGSTSTVDARLEAGSPTYYHSFVADRGRDTIGALWVQCEEEGVENVLKAGVFTPGLELLQVVFEEPVASGLYEPYAMTMILVFCGGRYIGSWADVSAQRTIQFTEEGHILADERGEETYPSTVYPGNNAACIPGAALLQVRPTLYMILECRD